jgi:DNA-binding SARP family transcriptional activator
MSYALPRQSVATVHLLGGPYVTVGGVRKDVPEGSKRLVAYVALRSGRVERRTAAGTLWPDGDEVRASGNLRSALWRLRGAGIEIISADKWSLGLASGLSVDLRDAADWATRLINDSPRPDDLELEMLPQDLNGLLPGCSDEWAILERERLRQRMLHALEALARLLAARQRYADAIEVALVGIHAEPLRETAHRTLIEIYLAEGNLIEARRQFASFRDVLRSELGVEPSYEFESLVHPGSEERCAKPASMILAGDWGGGGSAGRAPR